MKNKLSTHDVAGALDVSLGRVCQLLRKGLLLGEMFSGCWMIDPKDLKSFISYRKKRNKTNKTQASSKKNKKR